MKKTLLMILFLVASVAATAQTTIAMNNAAFVYSPFNWSVTSASAQTMNSGAYFRIFFTGTSASLTTDTTAGNATSEFWARVDGSPWTQFDLSTGNPTLNLATGLTARQHLLEVIVKQDYGWSWVGAANSVITITGLVLDSGATVSQPLRKTKNVLIFGDSITDGVHVHSTAGAPNGDDILADYAYALSQSIDAEIGIVGFGGTGIDSASSGNLTSTYDYVIPGVARTFSSPAPDLVIYNEGTNDSTSATQWTTDFVGIINGIRAAAPLSKHLILVPFNQAYAATVPGVAAAAASAAVTWQATLGWWNSADSPDSLHPYDYSHLGDITPRLTPVVQSLLAGTCGTGSGVVAYSY